MFRHEELRDLSYMNAIFPRLQPQPPLQILCVIFQRPVTRAKLLQAAQMVMFLLFVPGTKRCDLFPSKILGVREAGGLLDHGVVVCTAQVVVNQAVRSARDGNGTAGWVAVENGGQVHASGGQTADADTVVLDRAVDRNDTASTSVADAAVELKLRDTGGGLNTVLLTSVQRDAAATSRVRDCAAGNVDAEVSNPASSDESSRAEGDDGDRRAHSLLSNEGGSGGAGNSLNGERYHIEGFEVSWGIFCCVMSLIMRGNGLVCVDTEEKSRIRVSLLYLSGAVKTYR